MLCQRCHANSTTTDALCTSCAASGRRPHKRKRRAAGRETARAGEESRREASGAGDALLPVLTSPPTDSAPPAGSGRALVASTAPSAAASGLRRLRSPWKRALAVGGALAASLVFAWGSLVGEPSAGTTPAVVADAQPPATTLPASALPVAQQASSKVATAPAPGAKPAAEARKETTKTAAKRQEKASKTERHAARLAPPASAPASVRRVEREPDQERTIVASAGQAAENRYAQCLEIGSFLRREQCKWQACGGKWGQDGCPSYQSEDREINY